MLQRTVQQPLYRNVEPILRPKSITIVGVSERPDSWSARIFRNLRSYGFPGDVYLVNPRHRELYGARCFPSVLDVPGEVDQLVVILPAQHVPAAIEQGGRRGCRSAVVFSGGFSETNTETGLALEREMLSAADRYGVLICGPNCLGNVSTREQVLTYAEQATEPYRAGGLALVSQSSGLMGGVARYAHSRGLGLSYCIASGSEVQVDAADYLNFLVSDDATRVIALFIEAIRRPNEFAWACEKARAVHKPILILKIGKSQEGKEAAFTHTGALAGSYEAFVAFCRRYGLIELQGLDECVHTSELFLRNPLPQATGVAAIALSGGARGYLHDLGEELSLEFPQPSEDVQRELGELLGVGTGVGNPLDLGATGASDPEQQLRCLKLLGNNPAVGLIALQAELPQGAEFASRALGLKKTVDLAARMGKPLVFFSRSSYPMSTYASEFREQCSAPFLHEIRQSFQAISHVIAYTRWLNVTPVARRCDSATHPTIGPVPSSSRAPRSTAILSDENAFALLEQAGIIVARYALCKDKEAALSAAELIGYPVALKASVPGLTHKSETGGVRLGLLGPEEVSQAFDSIQRAVVKPAGSTVPVMVQEMVQGLLDLYVGGRLDPEFGPIVLFGFGGIFVEAFARIATRLVPVEIPEAEEMLSESGVKRGLRRLGVEDSGQAVILEAIVRMSQLVATHSDLDTVEINPLVFQQDEHRCIAVDAVAVRLTLRRS